MGMSSSSRENSNGLTGVKQLINNKDYGREK